jgi:hypothetical protein
MLTCLIQNPLGKTLAFLRGRESSKLRLSAV